MQNHFHRNAPNWKGIIEAYGQHKHNMEEHLFLDGTMPLLCACLLWRPATHWWGIRKSLRNTNSAINDKTNSGPSSTETKDLYFSKFQIQFQTFWLSFSMTNTKKFIDPRWKYTQAFKSLVYKVCWLSDDKYFNSTIFQAPLTGNG